MCAGGMRRRSVANRLLRGLWNTIPVCAGYAPRVCAEPQVRPLAPKAPKRATQGSQKGPSGRKKRGGGVCAEGMRRLYIYTAELTLKS